MNYEEFMKSHCNPNSHNNNHKSPTRRKRKPSHPWRRFFLCLFLLLLLGGAILFIYTSYFSENMLQNDALNSTLNNEKDSATDADGLENTLTDDEIASQVDSLFDTMNLESKIAQLFITSPEELTGVGIVVQAGSTTQNKLKQYPVGGLLFGDKNIEVLDQLELMLNTIESFTNFPIFLAIDEDGSARITNKNRTLDSMGIDFLFINSTLSFVHDLDFPSSEADLNIVLLEEQNVIEVFQNGADVLIATSDFYTHYTELLTAARSGTLDLSLIDEKVKCILTYKLQNNI